MSDLSVRLSECYASSIHDVLRELGYENCVLPPEIQALERGKESLLVKYILFLGVLIKLFLVMTLYFYGLKCYQKFQEARFLFVNQTLMLLRLWESCLLVL